VRSLFDRGLFEYAIAVLVGIGLEMRSRFVMRVSLGMRSRFGKGWLGNAIALCGEGWFGSAILLGWFKSAIAVLVCGGLEVRSLFLLALV
jgi:hypothetical protein